MTKDKVKDTAIKVTATVVGNILYSFANAMFIIPSGIVTGGTTGISLAVYHAFKIPVSVTALVFNVAMFILGLIFLGKSFAASTAISTVVFPVSLEVIQKLMGSYVPTQDVLLCTAFGGVISGVALGIVIRAGASTGGVDIPPLILKKYFGFPLSTCMYILDCTILLTQVVFVNFNMLLYGIIQVLLCTFVMDKTLVLGQSKMQIKIISKHSDAIRGAILTMLDRGVTMINGKTGYTHQEAEIVLSVVAMRELTQLKNIVQSIDPEAFMIINKVNEVRGRGFTMQKRHYDE